MDTTVKDDGFATRVIVYVTRQCNMHCQHCWVGAGTEHPVSTLPRMMDDPSDFLSKIGDAGVRDICLTGGEPFVEKPFTRKFVSEAFHRGFNVAIESNGSLLDATDVKLIADYVKGVSISLDSLDSALFDHFRGLPGAFVLVTDTLRRLVDAGAKVQVIGSVFPQNVHTLPEFIETLLEAYRVSSVKLNVVTPSARGQAVFSEQREYVSVIDEVARVVSSYRQRYWGRIFTNLPMALSDYAAPPSACDYKNTIAVLPDGSLSLCGVGMTNPELSFGDIRADLKRIWSDAQVLKLVRKIGPSTVEGVCSECIFGPICANACPAVVYSVYGTFFKSNPWCQAFRDAGAFPKKFLIQSLAG